MADLVLAIDQGTTGSTALVIDFSNSASPKIVGRATQDFPQHYPQAGWVEHDLDEVWASVGSSCRAALEAASKNGGHSPKDIRAIGITNQRETLCVYDRKTTKPACRAIVWQCRRSTEICDQLKARGLEDSFKEKTGLVLDPYFSGTKLTWLLQNNSEVASGLRDGRLVVGTIDSFVLSRLTNGQVHATEASNASRTLLYDIKSGSYDGDLLEALEIPNQDILPVVKDSAGVFGKTSGLDFLPDGIPISGILGDQQAALAGQTCFDVGEAKCTYGTGAFLLFNLGSEAKASKNGLLTTVAWQLDGARSFAFEGSSFVAGAAVQFIRDQLGFVPDAKSSESMAEKAKAAPEVYFVPALAGLGAPFWDPRARGAFLGLTRGSSKEQMVRAALEGINFQVCDLIAAMNQDVGQAASVLRVDGGACANNLLMQTQADLAGLKVDRPTNLETTAFGAALFAGLGAGIYSNLNELKDARQVERIFEPDSGREVEAMKRGWLKAVQAVQVFAEG